MPSDSAATALQGAAAIGDGRGGYVIEPVSVRAPMAGEVRVRISAAGIAHEYAEHDGGHDWAYWTRHLEESLRFFGRTLISRGTAA